MPKTQKRPSKAAKAAKKIVAASELLAEKKSSATQAGSDMKTNTQLPQTSAGVKPRPDKKRG